LEVSKY